MALIFPCGPQWAFNTNNLATTPSSQPGTFLTAGGNNTDGQVQTLLPALAHDVEFLRIYYGGFTANSADGSTLLDILFDPAGGTNWNSLIDDLLVGYSGGVSSSGSSPAGPCHYYDFPVWIPAGASVGGRARNATGGTMTGFVALFARGGNANPASWWCGQRVKSWGVNPSTSHGTPVMPGASPAWGAWTDVGAPIDTPCGALQFGVQGVMRGDLTYVTTDHWQVGVSAQPYATVLKQFTGSEAGWTLPPGLMWANLAAGTQLQARGMASNGAPVAFDVAVYTVH